jgi:hypothetical protein
MASNCCGSRAGLDQIASVDRGVPHDRSSAERRIPVADGAGIPPGQCALVVDWRLSSLRQRFRRTAGACGSLLLSSAVGLGIALPVFDFPPVTGPYAVGTVTRRLVDTSRAEVFSSDPRDRRELMVQFWYPAERVPGAQPTFYRPRSITLFFKFHVTLVHTRSVENAP